MEVWSCFSHFREQDFVKLVDCEQNGKNQYKKKKHNKHSSEFKMLR